MTWKSWLPYNQQDVGSASADCITAAAPAASKATVLAEPVNNTRRADIVLVLCGSIGKTETQLRPPCRLGPGRRSASQE